MPGIMSCLHGEQCTVFRGTLYRLGEWENITNVNGQHKAGCSTGTVCLTLKCEADWLELENAMLGDKWKLKKTSNYLVGRQCAPSYWSPNLQISLTDLANTFKLVAGWNLDFHWMPFDTCNVCEWYCMQCFLLERCIYLAKVMPPLCS